MTKRTIDSSNLPDLPSPPPLPAKEDKRRTELFLSALGLTGEYVELYGNALTLKEAINTAIIAAGFTGSERYTFGAGFPTPRSGANKSLTTHHQIIAHLFEDPSQLHDGELRVLADRLKEAIVKNNPTFLDCQCAALKARERRLPVYDRDPTVVLLRAVGLEKPEKMDHCGFIDAMYKLILKSNAFKDISAKLLPLPLGEGTLYAFLSHPTPAFAAQIGKILKTNPKIIQAVSAWNMQASAFEGWNKSDPPEKKEQRFARRWVIQHVMEHLTHATTGRSVSALDVSEYVKAFSRSAFQLQYFQSIALDTEKTLGLMHFLREKVRSGEMHYDDARFPLEELTTEKAIHAAGKKLLEENRALRKQIGEQAAQVRY